MNSYLKSLKLLFFLILINFQSYSQGGLIETKEDVLKLGLEEYNADELGFSSTELPNSFSMRKYAPPVKNQEGGTCVGWATSYSAMSIMHNVKYNITDPFVKYATAFDPYFAYSIIKQQEGDFSCDAGLYISEAAEVLKRIGVKKWSVPPLLGCNTKWNKQDLNTLTNYSKSFVIDKYIGIPNDDPEFIEIIKQKVFEYIPVVFVVEIGDSFQPRNEKNISGISSNGIWNPKDNESDLEGHAMTIVGYNDYKNGGSFEVMNSWGKDFGDNGFVWIKYSDFKPRVNYGWMLTLPDEFHEDNNPTYYNDGLLRVDFTNNNTYEGQFINRNSIQNAQWDPQNLGSEFNGFGQYLWDDNNVYSGYWNNGKQNGVGLWFKNSDYSMWWVKYDNGTFISSEELGFSPDEQKEVNQLKEYLKIFDSEIKLNSSSEEPDIDIRSSKGILKKMNNY